MLLSHHQLYHSYPASTQLSIDVRLLASVDRFRRIGDEPGLIRKGSTANDKDNVYAVTPLCQSRSSDHKLVCSIS